MIIDVTEKEKKFLIDLVKWDILPEKGENAKIQQSLLDKLQYKDKVKQMDKKQKPPTEEDIAVWIQSDRLEQIMRESPELFDVDNLYLPQTVKELESMKKKIGWQQ